MSATRPMSFISPLQLALATTFHQKFGCRKIIDMCNHLGFCSSYSETQLYEISAVFQETLILKQGAFLQFVADNADFNIDTVDGKNTFHNLGCIEIITPWHYIKPRNPINRLEKIPPESEIIQKGNISIQTYNGSKQYNNQI